jgi:hypothetical protein
MRSILSTTFLLKSVLHVASIILFVAYSSASDIAANTANRGALIGSAYQSEKELFVGQNCVSGVSKPTGTQNSTFSFEQSLTQTQAEQQLGFEAGGRARFGVIEASASARFMRAAVSNQFSISAVWLSDYRLPAEKLTEITKSEVGAAVATNYERWATTCGDEYVDEIVRGAKLFFSIRVDFASLEQKQDFEAKFSVSGPLASAEASLKTASKDFSRDVKITLSALQIGGDVSKITSLFSSTDEGRAGFVQCTLGDFEKCAAVIGDALKYATDVTIGFPSQIAPNASPGPAPILYRTAKYSAAGIYPQNYPYLDQANQRARSNLHDAFETQFALAVVADRLLELGMGAEEREGITAQKKILDGNIANILETSKVCYEQPLNCATTVQSMKLVSVDEKAFVLPTMPLASFRLLTTSKGIWSRAESVKYMTEKISKVFPEISINLLGEKKTLRKMETLQLRRSLFDVAPDEGASIVLYVEGRGLKEAILCFENRQLKIVPLTSGVNTYPTKFTDSGVGIVIESTRGNPGWIDVDLPGSRSELWSKDMPIADGVFYVKIRDVFGRSISFDLEYSKWQRTQTKSGSVTTITEKYQYRNRWWDSDSNGTSVSGDKPFSDEGSAEFTSSQ